MRQAPPSFALPHDWPATPGEAVVLQKALADQVETRDRLAPVARVAGLDVGFEARGRVTRAAVAVLSYPGLERVEQAVIRRPTDFPYVPGLLSFREVPALLEAMNELRVAPDLLLCDGQGYAHPRRFGLACHLGLLTDIPAIGVAKSRLLGSHADIPEGRGEWTPLLDTGETIGAVLRSRVRVKPLYISIGHRIALDTAIAWVMRCTSRYRLPETTRQAHRLASG